MFDRSTIINAASSQVSSALDGETIILSVSSGRYYGLDEVGQLVWTQIQQPTPLQHICDAIMHEYDVSADVCHADVVTLIAELVDEGLATVSA